MYSFDVFDTLLTRVTATPEGIFALMQEALQKEKNSHIQPYIRRNFFSLRIGAEQVARKTYGIDGVEEVTLEQIYGVWVKEHLITEEQAEELGKLERNIEVASVHGIPENIEKVKQLLEKRERVVFISDMYLDRDTIQDMLKKVDPVLGSLPLYVSSDPEKKGKWTGNLFPFVKEQENVSYQEWHHYGDNEESDYQIPKRFGIQCERYQKEDLLGIEKAYLKGHEAEASVQLSVGCARLARIYGKKSTAYRMGCSIGGVLLYPYIHWLLEDSREKGMERLYFIARDGFLLKEMADCLLALREWDIETKYVYGSRVAWRIPEGEDWKEEVYQIYWRSYEKLIKEPSDLAAFLQVTEEELLPYLPKVMKDPKRIWTVSAIKVTLDWLLGNQEFSKLLSKKYQEKRELLLAYLQQEIDTKKGAFAFVDLAGTGFTQECVARVMREYYTGEIHNYFYRRDMVKEGQCTSHVFYPYYVRFYVLLEMMCRAPHGQTMGYQRKQEGRVEPILSTADGEAIKEHGVPEFIEGAKEFAILYEQVLGKQKNLVLENRQILSYLEYIYYRPDKEVMEYFAEMPNMLTGREQKAVPFAPKLTKKEIHRLFWRQDKPFDHYYMGSDLDYSLLRCSKRQKKQIKRYQAAYHTWYGRLERKWYQRIYRKGQEKDKVILLDFLGERVAIYGAGKKGQELYQQVTGKVKVQGRRYHAEVVLWVDQNAEQCQKEGLLVVGLEQVRRVAYDQLVIAIAKRETAEKVKQTLLTYGVPEEKIVWVYDC